MYHKLIVNPKAGNGRSQRLLPYIEQFFQEKSLPYDIYITKGPKDAIKAAKKAAKTHDVLVAIGGDGTIHEVVNGMASSDAILGILPVGTGNDYARALGLPKEIHKACQALFEGNVKEMDLGHVLEQYFVNCVGVGFDGTVAYYANQGNKYVGGTWVYILAILKTLMTFRPMEMEIHLDERSFTLNSTLVAIGIGQSYGGGMKILPDAIVDDGLFDVCIIEETGRLKTLFTFPRVIYGKHLSLKEVAIYRSREVRIHMHSPMRLHMDGELFTHRDLHFTVIPKGIKVIQPKEEGILCSSLPCS